MRPILRDAAVSGPSPTGSACSLARVESSPLKHPLSRFQRLPPEDGLRLAAAARAAPLADPAVGYAPWYLRRWHLLPEGYLSPRSVRRYDRAVGRIYNMGSEARLLRRVTAILQRRGAPDVLEIGTGPGRALASIRRRVPGATVAGVDLSPYMVAAAKSTVGDEVDLRHGDATALPWADGAFDAVVALHTLGHVPCSVAEAMLDEVRRVLRPGGTMIIADHAWHNLPLVGWMIERRESLALGTVRLVALRPGRP